MKVEMTVGGMELLWAVSRRSPVTDDAWMRYGHRLEALGLIQRVDDQLRLTSKAWDVLYQALVDFYAAGPKNNHSWPYLPALPMHLARGECLPG